MMADTQHENKTDQCMRASFNERTSNIIFASQSCTFQIYFVVVVLSACFIFIEYFVFIYLFNQCHHSRETGCGGGCTTEQGSKLSAPFYPPNHDISQKTDHNTGNYMPYSLRQLCGFFFTSHRIFNIEGL